MTIHKEGTATIALTALVVGALNIANFSYLFPISCTAAWAVFILTLGLFLFIVSFFRMPSRNWTNDASAIVSPADGKVVVIEEVQPDEYYTEKRIQVRQKHPIDEEAKKDRPLTAKDGLRYLRRSEKTRCERDWQSHHQTHLEPPRD